MADRGAFDDLVTAEQGAMVVVTTVAGEARAGCLVGFHVQCSIDPPQYAVWLSRANHTFRVALLAEHLAVHLLGTADHDLAELFGTRTGDEVDKFAACNWTPDPATGVPLLDVVPFRMVGRRVAMLDVGGDHVCFVIEPVAAQAGGSAPAGGVLRLGDVSDLDAGHDAGEPPLPSSDG